MHNLYEAMIAIHFQMSNQRMKMANNESWMSNVENSARRECDLYILFIVGYSRVDYQANRKVPEDYLS